MKVTRRKSMTFRMKPEFLEYLRVQSQTLGKTQTRLVHEALAMHGAVYGQKNSCPLVP